MPYSYLCRARRLLQRHRCASFIPVPARIETPPVRVVQNARRLPRAVGATV